MHEQVLGKLDLTREVEDDELMEIILSVLEEQNKREYIPLHEKARLGKELFNAFRKLDLLQELIENEEITEVMINGTENIFVEKAGKIYRTDKCFPSRDKLEDVIQQIVAGTNRVVNEATPIADARLADGSRVNVVLHPVALNGPAVTIRKFPKDRITMAQLLKLHAVSAEVAEFLERLVKAGYNIFISGGTGAGKTTLLNALSQYIPREERIITIEDNAELQIQDAPNLVRLEARYANVEGRGEVTIRDLIRAALRMRPNRIIVGEVRGPEVIDMLQAMLTGHKGSLSTGHSDSPQDMLRRLETMVLMGMDIPLTAIQRQIASAIDIVIHVGRLRDSTRKILQIAEVAGCEGNEIQTRTLYEFQEQGEKKGRIFGEWKKIHEIANQEKLFSAGYQGMGENCSGV